MTKMETLIKERIALEYYIDSCKPEDKSDLIMQLQSLIDEIIRIKEKEDE